MNWNKHSDCEGLHAFLGASHYSWLNYTPEQLRIAYTNIRAKERGTELHQTAALLIKQHLKLQSTKQTINMYVNDAISFRMTPEQVLYYSKNAFGTADAISFRKEKGELTLRIHDLKTGKQIAKFEQLMIYAAFFCLEYRVKPETINIVLRIYQSCEVRELVCDPTVIQSVMDKVVLSDTIVTKVREEEGEE